MGIWMEYIRTRTFPSVTGGALNPPSTVFGIVRYSGRVRCRCGGAGYQDEDGDWFCTMCARPIGGRRAPVAEASSG